MNHKALVKLSNIIGIISIILLVYWVFTFISIEVLGLKIFRKNLTEVFYLSVLGILALMFGALILNVMFNLTRIAEKHNQDDVNRAKKTSKKAGLLFALSFPLLFGLLYGGDYLSTRKKEKMLVASARSIIENDPAKSTILVNYAFTRKWVNETSDIIELYSKTDKHFPHIQVIVSDTMGKTPVFLSFSNYYRHRDDTLQPLKKDFIQETTKEERDYLDRVFKANLEEVKFSASDGHYELFYPIIRNGKKIVLHFAEYQRYGKMGS
jgi:hypothetical protein